MQPHLRALATLYLDATLTPVNMYLQVFPFQHFMRYIYYEVSSQQNGGDLFLYRVVYEPAKVLVLLTIT